MLRLRGWISRSRRDRREQRSGAVSRPGARLTHSGVSSSTSPVDERRDHVRGAEEPALTVIEYGDFGCPFCFAASRPLQSLLDRYDSLRLVWRHFPDPELHPGADLAAELSELAAVHGKFWEAHSLLLAGRERFSTEDLLSVGAKARSGPGRGRVGDSRPHLSRTRPRGCRRRQEGGRSGHADVLRRRRAARGSLATARAGRPRRTERAAAVNGGSPQIAAGLPETPDRDGTSPALRRGADGAIPGARPQPHGGAR